MKYPLRYMVYDLLKREGAMTDSELLQELNKNDTKCSLDELNKVLMQLEILGLISVAWVSKDKRRVEVIQKTVSDTLNQ